MKKRILSVMLVIWCGLLFMPVVAGAQSYYPVPMMPQFQPYSSPYYTPYQQQYQSYQQQYPYVQPCTPPYNYSSCVQPPVVTQCWQSGWSNPQQLYRCGLSLVYARRYSEAIWIFQQFLNSYPQSSLADNALYWTGEAYYAQKQYYQALSYFQQILSRYPRGNKVPDALLKIALSYMSLNRNSKGCQVLNDLQYRYPNSEPARKAWRWMNRCGYGGYWGDGGTGYYSQPYSSNTPQPWYSESVLPKYW